MSRSDSADSGDRATATTQSPFDLPAHRAAKGDPALISDDETHFAAVAACLAETTAELTHRLDVGLTAPGRIGQEAMDRDMDVHRLTARLGTLRRYGIDLCLGRMVFADDPQPIYVGRLGLTDRDGRRLLVDWRSPVAEPFFAATHAAPMGLASRRRYRWADGRVNDYWDEVFTPEGLEGNAALDDQSAFIASLGSDRSDRMRDVLATIAADQDAVIRASSRGALVVEGGPGTGKTVVALHRTAYLLYSDPHLGQRRGGVLFVGPHQPYVAYVSDVLPSLGEHEVQICTVRDLVAEGSAATDERDADVAALKASPRMAEAVERAVRFYEEPPTQGMTVSTDWSDVWLDAADWADAFDSAEPGSSHNEARDEVWEALLAILVRKHHGDELHDDDAGIRSALAQDDELRAAFNRAWPLLEAADVVADLWRVPAYLRHCAPWLDADQQRQLRRSDPYAWTVSDLPLLDAARARLGDPESARLRHARESADAAERARMDRVVDELLQSDEDGMLAQLRQEGIRDALVDERALPDADADRLAGPFAHIVVDEAQELTDAEWQMLLRRCPSRSLTIVGDRAQARHGFTESWPERLRRIGLDRVEVTTLSINYRTPAPVMTEAEPVIRSVFPDANVPVSIRTDGAPVVHGDTADRDHVLDAWLAEHDDGIACVIGDPTFQPTVRVRSLPPLLAKGLEFDLVVLVDPDAFGPGVEGAVDRYVAMTRTTQQLVILTPPTTS